MGLDLNAVCDIGQTPLNYAVLHQAEISLSYLLAWNLKLDTQDKEGNTALFHAVESVRECESVRLVRLIAIRGPRLDIKNKVGSTVLDVAEKMEFDEDK